MTRSPDDRYRLGVVDDLLALVGEGHLADGHVGPARLQFPHHACVGAVRSPLAVRVALQKRDVQTVDGDQRRCGNSLDEARADIAVYIAHSGGSLCRAVSARALLIPRRLGFGAAANGRCHSQTYRAAAALLRPGLLNAAQTSIYDCMHMYYMYYP